MSDETVAQETNAEAEVEKRTDQADLDTLLAEFDQGTKKEPAPPPEPKLADLTQKVTERVKAELITEQQTKAAVKNLVNSIRGEVPEDTLSDDEIEDWLEGQAKRSEPLKSAWMLRHQKPNDWKKIEAGLMAKLNSKFGKSRIDPVATADREAVAQAVRGASTKVAADPAPNFAKMTDAELNKWKMENMK